MTVSTAPDLAETLVGIAPDSALAALRATREDIRGHIQGACRALVTPAEPGGVSLVERASLALRVALSDGDMRLAGHFRSLLTPAQAGAATASPEGSGRFALLMRFGDTVAAHPARIGQADIDALSAHGFSPQDIVAATQLAAFVPFQVRLLAGLRAMQGGPPTAASTVLIAAAPARFTMAEVGWAPRIPPVDPDTATPAQLAALDACPPAVRRSIYFLTLAQDPESLAERGALFNSVMYAPRGLPRAERELATAIVSMVNGCVYCCSVHARRFAELTREPVTMQRVLDEGFGAPLNARCRAITDFAAKLTATPGAIEAADLAPLRAAGLVELEMLDLVHAIAMFANANRLMQALGESMPPVGPPVD
jgi:uncharacterized peroxidase-related enzyme